MQFGELREEVLDANLALVREGLVVLTFGNVSGLDRNAGVMAIKPSGVPYEELTPESIVVVDVESGGVVAGDHRPSSDTPTHLVLYRRFDGVGGVAHSHSPRATAWAQAQRDLPCFGTTHADHFRGAVPATRALTATEIQADYEERTGDVLVETFTTRGLDPLDTPGALVASHGPFTWGPTAAAAVENSVALEAVAQMALDTIAIRADTAALGPDLLERHFTRKHGTGAYYGQPR